MVTLESVLNNKKKYKENLENVTIKRDELMQKLNELRQKKLQLTDEIEIATADFEETNLINEISSFTSSFKNCKLTLELIQLQEDALQRKIDAKTYANSVIPIKKAKEKLLKEEDLTYYQNETEKCKKALKLYTLMGDNKKVAEWKQNLLQAKQGLEYAREDMKEELEDAKENREIEEEPKKDEIDTRTVHNEDKPKTTKYADDKGYYSNTEWPDGSYEAKSTVIIQDGQKANFGEAITLSQDFQNFTKYEFKFDKTSEIFTEKRSDLIINDNGQVIGERKATEVENLNPSDDGTPIRTINVHEYLETDEGIFEINTLSEGFGEEYREQKNMTINNKLTGSIENIQYLKDEQGKEIYTYKENGVLGQKITKTERGTTIDIYKDGQPFATYEYDENGKALIPMGNVEQIPEDYVDNCFSIAIPDRDYIVHIVPDEWDRQNENMHKQNIENVNETEMINQQVSTQTLGKETMNEQNNVIKMDCVERMMNAQMREQTIENEENYELEQGA